ncbi:MAG: biotin/lipoyl-binding protein, partial [Woeseiaceae bacterium]|nr:biotin/lipoyl-binding protein [Woeseiaceae bacterium]
MNLGKFEKYRSWLLSAAIATGVALWLLSGMIGNPEPAADKQPATAAATSQSSVRVRTQSAEEVQRTIVVNGKTAPARIVQLSAETDGRVMSIGVERGNSAARGDLIVRLDARDRGARLAQAKALLKQREVEYEAREKLKSSSYVSEAQLQEAIASLEAARTEVMRAELDLGYMTIRAPFDGALQSRSVEQGDFV